MINELIFKAAQYMDEHGKTTGMYEDLDGQVCVTGALRKVCEADGLSMREETATFSVAYNHLTLYSQIKYGTYPEDLNDYGFATKEETVKFMMEAAEWEPTS